MRRNRLFLTLGLYLLPASYAVAVFTSVVNLSRVDTPFTTGTSPLASIGVAAAIQLVACLFSVITAASGSTADRWVIQGNTLTLLLIFMDNIYSACLVGCDQPAMAAVFTARCIVLVTLHGPKVLCRWMALTVKVPPNRKVAIRRPGSERGIRNSEE